MKKYLCIDIILVAILLQLLFLLPSINDWTYYTNKNTFMYNNQITLNDDVRVKVQIVNEGQSRTGYYTLYSGTKVSTQFIRTDGELYNLYLRTNEGEYISLYDSLSADVFIEKETIHEDLTMLINENDNIINGIIIRMIIFSAIAVILTSITAFFICRYNIQKNTHIVIIGVLIFTIIFVVFFIAAGLLLGRGGNIGMSG